jgi:ATP-binding cassette subfamily B protein
MAPNSMVLIIRETISLIWNVSGTFVKRRLVVVLVLLVAMAALTALGPLALKLVIDSVAAPDAVDINLPVIVALYVVSQWLARVAGEIRGIVYARAERRTFRMLSERLFLHLMRLPLKFHLDRSTGAISQALENGLVGYQMVLHHLVFTLLPVVVELGTMIIVLSGIRQPFLLAVFSITVMIYTIVFSISATRLAKPAGAASTSQVDASAAMTDSLLNYEIVKYFAAESVVQRRISDAFKQTEEEWVTFYRRYAVNGILVASIFVAFLTVTIWHAIYQVKSGSLTIGGLILVNSYLIQIVRPVEMFGYAMQGFSQGTAMMKRMLDLFKQPIEKSEADDGTPLVGIGKIEFDNVKLAYHENRPVLCNISFEVGGGRTLGVIGTSGSGKSTIVRLLVRMCDPDSGYIRLDDKPISEIAMAKLRRAIAVVPQDAMLFNDTIGFNIAFGKEGSSQAEIERAARLAHLHNFIMSLPEKYNTYVGERGVKLSGGERQRLSIARAVLKDPLVYVFDEATSSLDTRTEADILKNIQEISKQRTTLIIAHRLSTVVHAHEIVVLRHGIIAERGSHSYLIGENGIYATMWRAQNTDGSVGSSTRVIS